MKIKLVLVLSLICITGCDQIGKQLAHYLPELEKGSPSRLNEEEDGKFVDPTTIRPKQQLSPDANMLNADQSEASYGDPSQSSDYRAMMESTQDLGEDPGQAMSAFVGNPEYAEAMTLDEDDVAANNTDLAGEYTAQVGEFAIPDTSQGTDVTSQYIAQGGAFDPTLEGPANQDPTAQYLGNKNNAQGTAAASQPVGKPNPINAPRKNNLPAAIRPKNLSGSSNSIQRSENKPVGTKATQNIKIGIPGRVATVYAELTTPTTVPMLLESGTSMSFSVNVAQTREIPEKGTVYWVIHSQRGGFSRFALPVRSKELPSQLQGVVPQFRPNGGPFRTFLVLVDSSNTVKYLTNAVEIPWTP